MDRLGYLTREKNDLIDKKNQIKNEKPSMIKKILYVFGIGVTLVSSCVTFWNTTPSLIFCLTYLYTVGVPYFYIRNKEYKIGVIDGKSRNIQFEISILDDTVGFENNENLNKIKRDVKKCSNSIFNDSYEEYYCDDKTMDDGPKLRLKK
jgi:hypothetical protein